MTAIVVSPAPRQAWRRLVEVDPIALPYQTPDWSDAISKSAGYLDASRWYRFESGREAVLPLVRRSLLPPRIAPSASLPDAWGIGGVLATPGLTAGELQEIVEDVATLPALHTRIRPNPLRTLWESIADPRLTSRPRRVHVLDLEGGYDTVWSERFASKTRTGVRRAQEAGVAVEVGNDPELIDAFYDVLSQSVDRWAQQQHEPIALARLRFRIRDPRAKFHRISQSMGDACRIWVARHHGRPIAASMRLVTPGGNANASRSAMIKELAAPVRANDLLQQLAIKDACDAGCRYFLLGESGASQGLARYKERFGGVPRDYHEYHIDPWGVKHAERRVRATAKHLIGFKDDDTDAG